MTSKGRIDARRSFINLLSVTERKVKTDYMLKFLINKTKEDYKKQILYAATSKNLYLNTDIYSSNIRKSFNYITNNKKTSKRNSMQFKQNFGKKCYSIGNINMFNKNLKLNLEENKINLDEKVEEETDKEKESDKEKENEKEKEREKEKEELKLFNIENSSDRKKFDKLENLNSILELIDVHEKTQFKIIDDNIQKKLNMQRNKKKHALFHPSITYNKNNLIYNKKYKLIYDKDNSINKLYIHMHQNKKRKKNLFLNNIPNNKYNNNINSLSSETRSNYNNIPLSATHRIESPISIIPIKTISNYSIKIPPNKNKNQNQKSTTETTVTKDLAHLSNFSESSIFKTQSNIPSAKKRIYKADLILNKKKSHSNKNKQILKVYSDVLINYNKIKQGIKNVCLSDKREENDKKKNEMNIKSLIKKRKTDIKQLIQDLHLDYDKDDLNIDLEAIVYSKKNKIKERMKNTEQRILLNQVQQQVINEDKILSKKLILENNLEKKLKSRTKKLTEKLFEELSLKRKQLKDHIIGFKLRYESDYINKLMENHVLNFDVPKSLQALLHKYKVMKYQ